jgi:hypothetical protein
LLVHSSIPARIVKDATALSNFEYMGLASDTDYVDLAKKAVELPLRTRSLYGSSRDSVAL